MESYEERKMPQRGREAALGKMSESAKGSNGASRGDGARGRKKGKKCWRKKKRYNEYQIPKFKGATPDLKGNYIATHLEAPGKAEITHEDTMEALERHTHRTCLCPQNMDDFFEKGIKPVLKESEEPKGTCKHPLAWRGGCDLSVRMHWGGLLFSRAEYI